MVDPIFGSENSGVGSVSVRWNSPKYPLWMQTLNPAPPSRSHPLSRIASSCGFMDVPGRVTLWKDRPISSSGLRCPPYSFLEIDLTGTFKSHCESRYSISGCEIDSTDGNALRHLSEAWSLPHGKLTSQFFDFKKRERSVDSAELAATG